MSQFFSYPFYITTPRVKWFHNFLCCFSTNEPDPWPIRLCKQTLKKVLFTHRCNTLQTDGNATSIAECLLRNARQNPGEIAYLVCLWLVEPEASWCPAKLLNSSTNCAAKHHQDSNHAKMSLTALFRICIPLQTRIIIDWVWFSIIK